MIRKALSVGSLALMAGATQGQYLEIVIEEVSPGFGVITAQLFEPAGVIRAVISDLAFTMHGEGFLNFSYNSAFDSTFFGPATVSVTPTEIYFSGTNTLPPLNNPGGPDSSNPLHIASFNATDVTSFTVNGQCTGAYVGSPFDIVFFYQHAGGSPVPFSIEIRGWDIPAPATVAAFGFAGFTAMRRRR